MTLCNGSSSIEAFSLFVELIKSCMISGINIGDSHFGVDGESIWTAVATSFHCRFN